MSKADSHKPTKTSKKANTSPSTGEVRPADFIAQLRELQIEKNLTRFRSPQGAENTAIAHEAEEFTHLCPFTGHPDYARIRVVFRPMEWCVELKALKLYLQAYRNVGIPYEALIPIIYGHLRECLGFSEKAAKGRLLVEGIWKGRGGISSRVKMGSVEDL